MRDPLRQGARASNRAAVSFALLALGAAGAFAIAPEGQLRPAIVRGVAVAVVLACLAALALGRRRLPWLLLATGFALWATGNDIWYTQGRVSFADGLDAAGYLLLVMAAIAFVRPPRPVAVEALLDSAIIGTGCGLFVWLVAFEPMAHRVASEAAEVSGAVYPTLDIALCVALGRLLTTRESRRLPGMRALIGGFGCLLLADLSYAALFLHGGANVDTLYIELGRIGAYALFGFAALHPSTELIPATTAAPDRPIQARLAVLALTSLAAPLGLAVAAVRGTMDDPLVVAIWGVALILLVYVRMARLFYEQARTQAALLDTQRVLEAAQELAQTGGWSSELGDVETITMSRECCRLLGIEPDGYDGTLAAFLAVVHPDDRERVEREDAARTAAGETYELEYRIVRPDGEVRWIYDRGDFTCDVAGRPVRVSGVIQDVTERRLADEALRAAEARYRTLVEQLPLVTYVTDGMFEGPPSYVSPQISELLGYPDSEFTSDIDFLIQAVHPDDRQRFGEEVARFKRDGDRFECEYRFVAADGRDVWVLDQMIAVGGESATPHHFQGFVLDITTRKRAEQALQEAEARYRTLVEHLPLVTYIHKETLGQPPVYVSPSIEDVLGYTVETWLSNSEFFWDIVHPDDRQLLKDEMRRFERERDRFECEYRYRAADGREVWVLDQMGPVGDPQRPDFYQGFLVDITERKRAEESLQEAEARYRTLVEELPLTSYVSGLASETDLEYISPQIERLIGYTAEECLAERGLMQRIMHPDDVDLAVEDARRVRRDFGRFQLEYRLIARDGRTVWVFDEMTTARDAEGEPVCFQGFLLDITERKQLEEQLQHSRRMEVVGRLSGGIAHDFNNLLTVITGYSGLALDKLDGRDDVVRGHVEEVRRAAASAGSLTQQLLAFSRRQVLQPQVLDLSSVVEGLRELLGRMLGEHIALEIAAGPDTPSVLADPGPLEQTLVNLVVNAGEAMPDGGRLTIETGTADVVDGMEIVRYGAKPGRYATLVVRDTGVGMDPQTLARAFDPFFTTKDVGKGSGLGLSTVFGIVRQSGGWISVDTDPGAGTAVTVYFLPAEAAPSDEAEPPPRVERGPARVMLVEDEPVVRELVAEMLERQDLDVVAAPGPHEALELTEHDGPDLLVTDIVMPGMNGRELARRIRERHPDVQVVFLSGYTADTVLQRGGLGAGERFLQKPFTEADLSKIVREALEMEPAPVS